MKCFQSGSLNQLVRWLVNWFFERFWAGGLFSWLVVCCQNVLGLFVGIFVKRF